MNETLWFLLRHGYSVLFAWVLVEQLGLPVPSVPLLLAAGALAGRGRLNLSLVAALPIVAALLSDALWYELGRRRGVKVLQFLCRISLEPDSCVRRTENVFARHGARSLLVAKFVPGLNTAAPEPVPLLRCAGGDGLGGRVCWAGLRVQRPARTCRRPRPHAGNLAARAPVWRTGGLHRLEVPSPPAFPARVARRPNHAGRAQAEARCRRGCRRRGPAPLLRLRGRAGDHPGRLPHGGVGIGRNERADPPRP